MDLLTKTRQSAKRNKIILIFAILFAVVLIGSLSFARLPISARQLGFVCDSRACRPTVVPEGVSGMSFSEGAIDLTGDGLLEIIRLENGRLLVFQDKEEIWKSDPSWQVADAALGDPNGDGRNDILVALWKPDQEGNLTSHPFIVAYRGGRVKTIWGGSAVAQGIHELMLADVDGDGVQELIVLESAWPGEGPEALLRTLSVWDWHGWGFILRWRGEPGRYHNLGFAPHPTDGGTIIIEVLR